MPWCDGCSEFWSDENPGEQSACPSCGRAVAVKTKTVPWHFKLMLLAFAIYMIYRVYWLAVWLPKHW